VYAGMGPGVCARGGAQGGLGNVEGWSDLMNKFSNIVNEQTWQIPYKTQHNSTRHSTNVNNTGKRFIFPNFGFFVVFFPKCSHNGGIIRPFRGKNGKMKNKKNPMLFPSEYETHNNVQVKTVEKGHLPGWPEDLNIFLGGIFK